jgi:RNA polymerase sigma-70 factor (ECF subfamily)
MRRIVTGRATEPGVVTIRYNASFHPVPENSNKRLFFKAIETGTTNGRVSATSTHRRTIAMNTALSETALPQPTPETPGFAALVQTYGRDLHRYAYRLSGNLHTAEDLVQDTLLRAWRSLDKLQNRDAVKGWLFTIVRRENARRFQRHQGQISDIPTEELPDSHVTYDTSTEAFVLRRALRELPFEYREPLVLQVLHGLSQQEIADQLGLTSAGVGTRLFRARQKLRACLGERG